MTPPPDPHPRMPRRIRRPSRRPRRSRRSRLLTRTLPLVGAPTLVAALLLTLGTTSAPKPIVLPGVAFRSATDDPFAFTPGRAADLAARAARGEAHILFVKSPGGILATARRVARLRPLILAAAHAGGIDPAVLEGIVLLESGGRPDAQASNDLSGAVGLTQILAETAQNLLGMHVDVAASQRLTGALASPRRAAFGDAVRRARLKAQRQRVDERFDPVRALAGTVRYLQIARQQLGREDLAVVSYHMGIGNLQHVIAAFGGGQPSYAQLYFDSAPDRHAAAWQLLSGFGDDSSLYYWKVLAAERIMELERSAPAELARQQTLQSARGSAEEVLHPPASTPAFANPPALAASYAHGDLVPLPARPAGLFLRYDRRMGALAAGLGQRSTLYRGLRPGALALLAYIAARVRALSKLDAPLTVTTAVLDARYRALLGAADPEFAGGYDLHATGWTFDISRRYAGRPQAAALQFMLDRLEALDLIAWRRIGDVIHVVVSSGAAALVPRLRPLR